MKPDWYLIANSSRARLVQREPGCPMAVLCSFEHAPPGTDTPAAGRDHYGRSAKSWTYGSSSYAAPTGAHRKEQVLFARDIARQLDVMVLDGRCHSLTLYAASPFLGILREEIGGAARRKLVASHDLDLTAVGLTELERRIPAERVHFE